MLYKKLGPKSKFKLIRCLDSRLILAIAVFGLLFNQTFSSKLLKNRYEVIEEEEVVESILESTNNLLNTVSEANVMIFGNETVSKIQSLQPRRSDFINDFGLIAYKLNAHAGKLRDDIMKLLLP